MPQFMAGVGVSLLVTVPEPVPAFVTVSLYCGAGEKVAVTVTGAVPIVILQGDVVPVQGPLQPEKTEPVAAEAVSVIMWPDVMALAFVQVVFAVTLVQLRTCTFGETEVSMPVTVPVPLPVPPLTVTVI